MAKTVEISGESFKRLGDAIKSSLQQAQAWIEDFFRTIDTYETIAVSAIGIGIILIVAGSILM
ncbi:MAG: hypothetical protein ACOCU6_00030 [Nanoarchaeota archaeon]